MELENDDEVLAAALSFVDEVLQQPLTFDPKSTTDALDVRDEVVLEAVPVAAGATALTNGSAEGDGSSNVSKSKPARRKRPSGFDPNRARAERKVELAHLRQQVQELEGKLAGLNGSSTAAVSLCASGTNRGDDSGPAVWEAIAVRQRTQRQESERESIRLRFVLEEQLKVARSLEKLLKKRMPSEVRCSTATCLWSSADFAMCWNLDLTITC